MSDFATVQDVIELFRELTPDESARAAALLPVISDTLRYEATKVGKNLDTMISDGEIPQNVVKAVTVDIAQRVLRQNTQGEAMTQESQSALGYVWSGTYAAPGGGVSQAIMKNDLKRLGLKRQRYGVLDIYGTDCE